MKRNRGLFSRLTYPAELWIALRPIQDITGRTRHPVGFHKCRPLLLPLSLNGVTSSRTFYLYIGLRRKAIDSYFVLYKQPVDSFVLPSVRPSGRREAASRGRHCYTDLPIRQEMTRQWLPLGALNKPARK